MDYYSLFVESCAGHARSMEELEDKKLRVSHNRAMTRTYQLTLRMYAEPDKCADIARRLLIHEEETVRISAASYCIQARVHEKQARAVLRAIEKDSASFYSRLTAGQCLRYCKPFT